MSEDLKVKDAADAVKGLAEAVPVYDDLLQPAVREVGTGLSTVAKLIHIALAPVSAAVWGYDKIREFVETKVTEKLKEVPPEQIVTPKANVAGPALEALKYSGSEDELAEMYANLLASAMDQRVATTAHPGFVEVIRQMTSDEARLMRLFQQNRPFPTISIRRELADGKHTGGVTINRNVSHLGSEAGCAFPAQTPVYLDNLSRLGLVEMPEMHYTGEGVYDALEKDPSVVGLKQALEVPNQWTVTFKRGGVWLTEFGKQFARVCVR